jgi:hypothetical protein
MTECNESLLPFEAHFSRQVVAHFTGDRLTTDGGSLLLRQADRKIGLLRRVAAGFTDYRQPERVEHRLEEMLAQRIYGLALGYEDLNDHEQRPCAAKQNTQTTKCHALPAAVEVCLKNTFNRVESDR